MAREGGGGGPVRALIFLALAIGAGSFALVVLYQLITNYQLIAATRSFVSWPRMARSSISKTSSAGRRST